MPGSWYERLRRQVIYLVRPCLAQRADERALIEEISLNEREFIGQMGDPIRVINAASSNNPEDLITFLQQEFSEIRPILTGDARNQCAFRHQSPNLEVVGRTDHSIARA